MINVGCLWLQSFEFISQTNVQHCLVFHLNNDSNGDGDTDDGCIDGGNDDPDT